MKFEDITAGKSDANAQYKIFLDLDGVLCDFEKKVKEITGKLPHEQTKSEMWKAISRYPQFYAKLDWMPDGLQLWNFCKKFNPEVLTGVPHGNWAPGQKKVWCGNNLGWDVTVHTVWARDKQLYAKPHTILIDDTEKNIREFAANGGIAILHTSAANSIAELKKLGFE